MCVGLCVCVFHILKYKTHDVKIFPHLHPSRCVCTMYVYVCIYASVCVYACVCVCACNIICSLSLGLLLFLLLVVFQEEVIAGHGECPDQDDELSEVHLSIIVGV